MKLLIVDDSALMRKHLSDVFTQHGDFVVRAVRNGAEALECLEDFDPDVITLDINMPQMDGITCLSHIMVTRPKPVVMVSSLTEEGAEITLQALALGAVDFVQKPGGTITLSLDQVRRELVEKVRAAGRARVKRSTNLKDRLIEDRKRFSVRTTSKSTQSAVSPKRDASGLVLIGVSTGGPGVLEEILPKLPQEFPWPVVVAQHMPRTFTGVFARRLDNICANRVVEVSHQMQLQPGVIYIAKGEADVAIARRSGVLAAVPVPAAAEHLWHPSVQRLVTTALDVLPAAQLIGVMLTGMGDDGAAAMANLYDRGGQTIAQDSETSVVFGMPNELIRRGGATVVLPCSSIAEQLNTWVGVELKRATKLRGPTSAHQG